MVLLDDGGRTLLLGLGALRDRPNYHFCRLLKDGRGRHGAVGRRRRTTTTTTEMTALDVVELMNEMRAEEVN
jgi:hypothetical protein